MDPIVASPSADLPDSAEGGMGVRYHVSEEMYVDGFRNTAASRNGQILATSRPFINAMETGP